jgi:hypothetical protein
MVLRYSTLHLFVELDCLYLPEFRQTYSLEVGFASKGHTQTRLAGQKRCSARAASGATRKTRLLNSRCKIDGCAPQIVSYDAL